MSFSRRGGGSRYLYEPFDAASARIDAHERVFDERWKALERRLATIEGLISRLEGRLWMAVFGAASFLAADILYAFFTGLR